MADRKLTLEQIEEIKAMKAEADASGKPFVYSEIGRMFGVTGQTIRRNVAPSEADLKPRPAAKYDPVAAKKRRGTYSAYQIYAYKSSPDDRKIIEKLESVKNKQKYIKTLILDDINKS